MVKLKDNFKETVGSPLKIVKLRLTVDPDDGEYGFRVDSSWVPPSVSIEDACLVVGAFV